MNHNYSMSLDYCDCGMPQMNDIESEKCEKCGQQISPARLKKLRESQLKNTSDDERIISREGGFRVSTVSYKTPTFPIVTSNYVPGKEASEVIGLVFSSGTRRMALTSSNLTSNTYTDALKDMELKAKIMGADGVISLQVSIEHGGTNAMNANQTVTLVGTAVKLK